MNQSVRAPVEISTAIGGGFPPALVVPLRGFEAGIVYFPGTLEFMIV
jgi:hypothetical protein